MCYFGGILLIFHHSGDGKYHCKLLVTFIAYMAAINCKYALDKRFRRGRRISHKCLTQFHNAAFLASTANEKRVMWSPRPSSLCPITFWPILIKSESQVDISQTGVSISLMRTDGWKRKIMHKLVLALGKRFEWGPIGHPRACAASGHAATVSPESADATSFQLAHTPPTIFWRKLV